MYLWIYYFAPVITNDSQRSYSFGKTQNVEVPELSQEKKFNVSLQKDFVFCFHTHIQTHTHTYTHTHTHTHTHKTFLVLQKIFYGGDRRSSILRTYSTSPNPLTNTSTAPQNNLLEQFLFPKVQYQNFSKKCWHNCQIRVSWLRR